MKAKKLLTVGLVAGLIAGSLALPAEAKKKKKKKPPQPVETTMYMHGVAPFGEVDGAQWLAEGSSGRAVTTLDGVEPSGSTPKSMNFFSPGLNDQCTGLPLAFPTFTGDVTGTITGDATLSLNFASAPAEVTARIWADVGAFSACNDAYIAPASEVVFDVPAGQNTVEVVFEGLDLPVLSFIMVEILVPSGTDYGGQVGRLLYDSTSAASSIVFDCIPEAGAASCLPE